MGFFKKLFGFGKKVEDTQAAVDPREYLLRETESVLNADPAVSQVTRLPGEYGLSFLYHGKEMRTYLENLFAETREVSPEERTRIIERFISAISSPSGSSLTWEEARERLLPVPRAASFGGQMPTGAHASSFMVERRTIPFLRELLVVDLPETSMYVQPDLLEQWGVSVDEAFQAAYAHLDTLRDVGVELQEERPSPLWSVDSNDTYEASRLLLPGFLASFAGKVKGRPVAAIPTRSMMLITGDQDPVMLERLCDVAEREHEASSRGISFALYTVDDAGRVVPYRRPGDDALAQRIRGNHVRFAMVEYGEQKALLEAQHQSSELDVFVPSFSVIVRERDSRPISWCSWAREVDSMLPETDVVIVEAAQEGSDELCMVPFADVLRLAGHCLTPVPGAWPPRHRTLSWPDDAVLEKLRAAKVDPGSIVDP
nr:DUF1444 family protein [Myxococcus sp. MH1]